MVQNGTPQVIAHRVNSLESLRAAAEWGSSGLDWAEFDLQLSSDHDFVLSHSPKISVSGGAGSGASSGSVPIRSLSRDELVHEHGLVDFTTALNILAGRVKVHVDLKFSSPVERYLRPLTTHEVRAAQRAVATVGAQNCLVSSFDEVSVQALRQWSKYDQPDLLVGLCVGTKGRRYGRFSEISVRRKIKKSEANLVLARKNLARTVGRTIASQRDLPLLVWTVNSDADLAFWLDQPDVWAVSTDRPSHALELR